MADQKVIEHTWQFVCQWYRPEEIARCIAQGHLDGNSKIPADVTSAAFADWITDQSRLAMARGIELAKEALFQQISQLQAELAKLKTDNAVLQNEIDSHVCYCGHCACQSCHDAKQEMNDTEWQ